MLSLDSTQWAHLHHAYGCASDIPEMLRQLEEFPPCEDYQAPPYFMLWSSLCHQGDVYTASYAAVPHLIRVLASAPTRAHWNLFLLPASIEIARASGRGPEVPVDLKDAYFQALQQIPALAAQAAKESWDEDFCRTVAGAVAVAKGHPELGEGILQLEPDTLKEFMHARFGAPPASGPTSA